MNARLIVGCPQSVSLWLLQMLETVLEPFFSGLRGYWAPQQGYKLLRARESRLSAGAPSRLVHCGEIEESGKRRRETSGAPWP